MDLAQHTANSIQVVLKKREKVEYERETVKGLRRSEDSPMAQ